MRYILVSRNNWSNRLKSILPLILKSVYGTFMNLNLFPHYYFGTNVDRIYVKYLGRQATRFYIVLFLISFFILALYATAQHQIKTKDFKNPTFERYKQLIEVHGNNLKCTCSSLASIYGQYVQIEPVFHPVGFDSFMNDSHHLFIL